MIARDLRCRAVALASAATAAVLLGACPGPSAEEAALPETTLARAQRTGSIRVGYANEAPFAYLHSSSGRLTGEAPEIARVVLSGMGIHQIETILTEFGSLIPGLKAGRFDIIAAGMYVLPTRCAEVAFSNPTYSVGEAFVVRKGNPLSLHGYKNVAANTDTLLGVVAGAVERSYALKLGVPPERVVLFPDPPSAFAALEAGRIHAYAATALTARDLLSKSGSGAVEQARPFRQPVVDGREMKGYGAFAFRKEDSELLHAFNHGLNSLIGTAEHLDLVGQFGFTEAELPGGISADELCSQ